MTWRDAVAAWKDLETRRPIPRRVGVAGLLGGSLAMLLSQAGPLPQLPAGLPPVVLGALGLLAVLLGRRLLWNDSERRLRLLWRLLGFSTLVIGLGFAGRFAGLPLDRVGMLTSHSGAMLAATLSLLVVLTLASILAVRLLDRRPVRELGIVPGPGFWEDFGFGLGLGAFLMTLILGTQLLLGWVQVVELGRSGDGATSFARGFLNMTLLFVAVGFYEELATRGYLLRALAQGFACRRIPPAWALGLATFLSSAAFGLGHLGNPHSTWVSTANIVLAGIVLSLPYVLTGRLAASIGLHITWNLFQGSVYGFPVSGLTAPATLLAIEQRGPVLWTGGAFGPEAGFLGVLAMLVAVFLIARRESRRRGSLALHERLVSGADRPPATPLPEPRLD